MKTEDEDFNLFIKDIKEAETVISSGSLSDLRTSITQWKEKEWLIHVFSGLLNKIEPEYTRMDTIYKKNGDQIEAIAWHARNLLELSIWVFFCTKKEENAKQFYDDALRDLADVIKAFGTYSSKVNGEESTALFNDGQSKLQEAAKEKNIDLSQKFQKVNFAATEVSNSTNFILLNKQLSKFVHPTALSILGNKVDMQTFGFSFYHYGCISFLAAFNTLKEYSFRKKK